MDVYLTPTEVERLPDAMEGVEMPIAAFLSLEGLSYRSSISYGRCPRAHPRARRPLSGLHTSTRGPGVMNRRRSETTPESHGVRPKLTRFGSDGLCGVVVSLAVVDQVKTSSKVMKIPQRRRAYTPT